MNMDIRLRRSMMTGADLVLKSMCRCMEIIESYNGSDTDVFMIECFSALEELNNLLKEYSLGDDARKVFFNAISVLDKSVMHRRMRAKPLGYSGDYLLIDWIYTRKTAKSRIGHAWDRVFHEYPGVQAVINRKRYLAETIDSFLVERTAPGSILDVGCGSGRDLYEALEGLSMPYRELPSRVSLIHYVDHEPNALSYAKGLFRDYAHTANVMWECQNALRLKPQHKYDLVWCAGLFDYLNDVLCRRLIKKMWSWLNEGGRIVFGNFHPRNPTRLPMEMCGGWYLIHRTEEELLDLAVSSGVPEECVSIEQESLGINLFCCIQK